MLKKSPRSAWILAASCAAAIFLVLFVFQSPDLNDTTALEATALFGLILFAITTVTFFSVIARSDERYYGLPGLAGWVLTGLLMSLSLWWIQTFYPTTFGLIGVAVIGFFVFRWFSFWLVWTVNRIFNQ